MHDRTQSMRNSYKQRERGRGDKQREGDSKLHPLLRKATCGRHLRKLHPLLRKATCVRQCVRSRSASDSRSRHNPSNSQSVQTQSVAVVAGCACVGGTSDRSRTRGPVKRLVAVGNCWAVCVRGIQHHPVTLTHAGDPWRAHQEKGEVSRHLAIPFA